MTGRAHIAVDTIDAGSGEPATGTVVTGGTHARFVMSEFSYSAAVVESDVEMPWWFTLPGHIALRGEDDREEEQPV